METTVSTYEQQAIDFLNATGATLTITYSHYGKHFNNDKDERDVYKCVLQRGTRKYEFDFGQSVFHSGRFVLGYKNRFRFAKMPNWTEIPGGYRRSEVKPNADFAAPTAYAILACLQKYDVGTFDDFINEFGYEFSNSTEYKATEKTYKAVVKEFKAMQSLFNDTELEQLQEIS